MKAVVNGGTKIMNQEVSIDITTITKEWLEEQKRKKEEEAKPKPEPEPPKPHYSSRLKKVMSMLDSITLYYFNMKKSTVVKHKAVSVYENKRRNTVQFKMENNVRVDLSWEEGKMRYQYLWLSEENDDLAMECFKKHCESKIDEHLQEIARIEILAEQEWNFR